MFKKKKKELFPTTKQTFLTVIHKGFYTYIMPLYKTRSRKNAPPKPKIRIMLFFKEIRKDKKDFIFFFQKKVQIMWGIVGKNY